MIKEFLKPTRARVGLSIGAFILTGLAIEPFEAGGKVGDLPLINSLLVFELMVLLAGVGEALETGVGEIMWFVGAGLMVSSVHLLLSYVIGCTLGFPFHEKRPLNEKLAIGALGSALAVTLVVALLALSSQLEAWDGQSAQRPSVNPRVLSDATEGKLSLGSIRVVSPEHAERIKASLRDAGLELTDREGFDYDLRVDIAIAVLEDENPAEVDGNEDRCGPFQNVRYRLIGRGLPLVELEANGWTTGGCMPQVFNRLSRVLAGHFLGFASGTGRRLH